jgi:hypothetical protein
MYVSLFSHFPFSKFKDSLLNGSDVSILHIGLLGFWLFCHCLVFKEEHIMLKQDIFSIFICMVDAVESAGTEIEKSCFKPN